MLPSFRLDIGLLQIAGTFPPNPFSPGEYLFRALFPHIAFYSVQFRVLDIVPGAADSLMLIMASVFDSRCWHKAFVLTRLSVREILSRTYESCERSSVNRCFDSTRCKLNWK